MSDWNSSPIRIADGESVDIHVYENVIFSIRLGSVDLEDHFWMEPHQARSVAVALLAAADYAEGKA